MGMTVGAAVRELEALDDSCTVGEAAKTAASAMLRGARGNSGVIGGGGLGKIALSYGYYRYQTNIMIVCVVLLVLMVQAFQSVGTLWATKSDKRLRK